MFVCGQKHMKCEIWNIKFSLVHSTLPKTFWCVLYDLSNGITLCFCIYCTSILQCQILEKERDEATKQLLEIEQGRTVALITPVLSNHFWTPRNVAQTLHAYISVCSVSAQLLKEMDALDMQFQIERSCRESAEAFAVKVCGSHLCFCCGWFRGLMWNAVIRPTLMYSSPSNLISAQMTKENKALKRRSQALLPLISEVPENVGDHKFDLENDLGPEEDSDSSVVSVLNWQSQVRGKFTLAAQETLQALEIVFQG